MGNPHVDMGWPPFDSVRRLALEEIATSGVRDHRRPVIVVVAVRTSKPQLNVRAWDRAAVGRRPHGAAEHLPGADRRSDAFGR
jgi:hypothetical protein